jgi:hypothetical protein
VESAKAEVTAALEASRGQLAERLAELAATHRDLQQTQTRAAELDQAVAALREDLRSRDARLLRQASQIEAFQRLVIRTRQGTENAASPGAPDGFDTKPA